MIRIEKYGEKKIEILQHIDLAMKLSSVAANANKHATELNYAKSGHLFIFRSIEETVGIVKQKKIL